MDNSLVSNEEPVSKLEQLINKIKGELNCSDQFCKHVKREVLKHEIRCFTIKFSVSKSHFEEDGTQNYLVFQPLNSYFKVIVSTDYVSSWKSKGLSDETIKPPSTSDNGLTTAVSYYGTKMGVKFIGICLKQPAVLYTHGTIVNIYIVYELGAVGSNDNDPTLKNCLFGAVTLTKNTNIDKYGCSSYGFGSDRKSSFWFPGGGFGQNVLIFGADMSSSAHIDNKKKDILVLGKGPTQGLKHTLTSAKIIPIILQWQKRNFVWACIKWSK